ncbi:unnamed protein product, partial [Ixodes pacificus]
STKSPAGKRTARCTTSAATFGPVLVQLDSRLRQILTGMRKLQREPEMMACIIATKAVYAGGKRRGGTIKVQPTAIARRHPGISRGNKRVPAGCPSKGLPAKRAKKEHSFSTNMKKDVPNAKSHGIGH